MSWLNVQNFSFIFDRLSVTDDDKVIWVEGWFSNMFLFINTFWAWILKFYIEVYGQFFFRILYSSVELLHRSCLRNLLWFTNWTSVCRKFVYSISWSNSIVRSIDTIIPTNDIIQVLSSLNLERSLISIYKCFLECFQMNLIIIFGQRERFFLHNHRL